MSEDASLSLLPRHIVEELIAGANAVTPAASLADHLTPPIGTSFFIKKDFTIIEHQDLSWYITAYVYVTGASPLQSDFEANGGQIHIVLVHGGRGVMKAVMHEAFKLRVTFEGDPRPEIQLPSTGSGEVQYNNKGEETGYTRYTIDFERTMAMLRNNGMEPFSFNATFEQVYDLYVGDQTGAISPDGKGVEFQITAMAVSPTDVLEIHGLSTFKTSKLIQSINFTCNYELGGIWIGYIPIPGGSKTCTIPLSFA